MQCALCTHKKCREGKDCSSINIKVGVEYIEENLESMKISAQIESRYYMKKTRLEELILYAGGMGYKNLGIAFGLDKDSYGLDEVQESKKL